MQKPTAQPEIDLAGLSPAQLVEILRLHVDAIQTTFDHLDRFGAFDRSLLRDPTAEPWRYAAREQRARLSVIV